MPHRVKSAGRCRRPIPSNTTALPARRAWPTARCSLATAAPNSVCVATSPPTTSPTAARSGASTRYPGNPADGFENDTMKMAAETWSGEWWKLGGGGTAWDSMAYDPELNLLYIGTGNGSPWNPGLRSDGKGDNLFLSSIVAVNADTGEYVWHYQTTPGDGWDYTATQHMILAELDIDGEYRKVILQAPRERLLLRARPRDRRVSLGRSVRADDLGKPCQPGDRPARRPAGSAILGDRRGCNGNAGLERRAQLASHVVQPRYPARLHSRAADGVPIPRSRRNSRQDHGWWQSRRRHVGRRFSGRSPQLSMLFARQRAATWRPGTLSPRRKSGACSTMAF